MAQGQPPPDPGENSESPSSQTGKDEPDANSEPAESKEFKWPMNPNLTATQKEQLTELLDEFQDVFAHDITEIGVMEGEVFRIALTDETPIFKTQYKLSQYEKEILTEQMEERKSVGFIRESTSKWAFPVTMPPKKDVHGNWADKRPCVDFRALNKVTPKDHYPLPTPEDIFDELADSLYFHHFGLAYGIPSNPHRGGRLL